MLKRSFIVLLLAAALGAAGCTTVDSDMPWNTPQSWEGTPGIPGLSGDRYGY